MSERYRFTTETTGACHHELVTELRLRFDDPVASGLATAAVARATELGAGHAEARLMTTRSRHVATADAQLELAASERSSGMGVRVLVDGVWGFASSSDIGPRTAVELAEQAVLLARASAGLVTRRVELAPEPRHVGHWQSTSTSDPFAPTDADIVRLLASREGPLLAARHVLHTDSTLEIVEERTLLATSEGTLVSQCKTRTQCQVTILGVDGSGEVETVRTLAPPTARGWEYLMEHGWDWDRELDELPEHLAEKLAAPSVQPGRTTLVIDPSNLWLTIHESIGHATELDRALGYEANYAGTSFATPDRLGTLQYGSALMNVRGDRTTDHGLATTGWDDEGVSAQSWDIIRDGVLVGYQLDRAMAHEFGYPRSNGCAYADSALSIPIQRMPNVSLLPGTDDVLTPELIAGVEDGYFVVGDRSWSIDMQRYNFQFTGQRFYRIRAGRLAGQVRDLVYQSRTPDFWGSMVAVGGPATYVLGGALNCGKAQPGQVAAVSHGCPAAVFENVTILNAAEQT